jgi:hypothetical protein
MPEKPSKLMPALYGGIVIGVISGLPFISLLNCLCCAGVLLGGFLSVFFYKKDLTPQMPPLESNDALQLGALAGLFGAIVGNILSAIILYSVGNLMGEAMVKFLEGLRDQMPPGTIEQIEEGVRSGKVSPVGIVVSLIIDPIFGLLGGLIGYSVFKPKAVIEPPAPPAPML